MKKRITLFLVYLAFWYLLFFVTRVLFLLVYFDKTSELTFTEIIKTFVYGFRLDIAISAYFAMLPSLVLTFTSLFRTRFIKYLYHSFTLLGVFICVSIISGDLMLYRYWGFRLDATPFFYMTNLRAMTASVSIFTVIGGILAVLFFTGLVYYIYLKIFTPALNNLPKSSKSFFILLPSTLLLIVLMRGGIGISTLNTSSAYFSKKQYANHAAINPVWNVGITLTQSDELQHKYIYYSETDMEKYLAPIRPVKDSVLYLLKNDRPDIILFITESLTAKVIEATEGKPGIMPELNQLVKEGILFDHIYAASDRTDKGIAAVLAGYPSLPGSSALKYQKLTEMIAMLPEKLNVAGYKSEFYYGGTLEFANYQSFLVQSGYDKMVSDKDFPAADLKSKWGAFDHIVFNRCLAETPDNDKHFFKTILTLTSHEPFETPVEPVFKGNDEETKYLNSLHYTDKCFGDFIREAKKKKWWDNTLVIIIADHGSRMPGNNDIFDKEKYHIPMIWLGGALKVKDTVIENLASQTDLAATLCGQLNIDHRDFKFSKNILTAGYKPFSFFTFNNGFGFMKPGKTFIYSTVTNTYSEESANKDSINANQGKAYLQSLFMDFRNKNK
jgi:phosphoglycerol transferase MdoB-like AlkP superfamily enzyme